MKKLFLILIPLIFTGCANLKNKSVNMLGAGSALHIKTSLDKEGSVSPEVFIGSKASIISTAAPIDNEKHSPSVFNVSRSYSIIDYFFGNTQGNICISYTTDGDMDIDKVNQILNVIKK